MTATSRAVWLLALMAVLLGAHLRIQAVTDTQVVRMGVVADAADYLRYADNLNRHGVYSRAQAPDGSPPPADATRAPGYGAFVAFISQLFGADYRPRGIQMIQAVIGTITVMLSFILFRRLASAPFALLATSLVAINPHLINLSVYFLTETLFTFALIVCFLFVVRYGQAAGWGTAVACGALLGSSTLVRPSLSYFPWIQGVLFWSKDCTKRAAWLAVAMLIAFLSTQLPWALRNMHATGAADDPALKINFLHHGMYPGFTYRDQPRTYGIPYRFDPNSQAISRNLTATLTEIRRRFAEEPVRHLHWFLLEKPVAFWSWRYVQGTGDIFLYRVHQSPYLEEPLFQYSHRLMRVIHWPLMLMGVMGCLLVWLPAHRQAFLRGGDLLLARSISALLIYYTAIHMIGAPFPRYSVPLRPFMYGMSAYAACWAWAVICHLQLGAPKLNPQISTCANIDD